MISIRCTEDERSALMRPVGRFTQRGGFQRLQERIQCSFRLTPDGWVLDLPNDDAERVITYASSYGEGTYQKCLRAIEPKVRAALNGAREAQAELF